MSSHNHHESSASTRPGYETEYSGDQLLAVAVSFSILEIVFVGFRYLAQRLSRKPFGLDDWLMIPALILCLGLNASSLIGMKIGYIGYHISVVAKQHPEALVPWAKVLVIIPIIYSAACCLPKVVMLVLYLRLFIGKAYRITCYILIAMVISLAVADIITGACLCTPIAFMWDKSIKGGHCIDIPAFYRYGTLPNAITDLFMLILPLPVVWNLRQTRRIKIGLTLTFLTGSVGMITSILRCVAFFTNDPLKDGTWISVTFLNWSIIEPGTYLIAACLPCYKPFVNHFFKRDSPAPGTPRWGASTGKFKPLFSPSSKGQKPITSDPEPSWPNADEFELNYDYSHNCGKRSSDKERLTACEPNVSYVASVSAQALKKSSGRS
ncbi:hypothetical protein HIM_02271 [Hirsutella minnesotensis 3608]|nr:hypothetical protein HIM_02271 [Hirsutella minnesotensis 3608]